MTLQEIQTKYEEALARTLQLERENVRLKEVLREYRIAVDEKEAAPTAAPRNRLTAEERVNLFRSLFKGREDVFARRWQSKATGKAGYQPVCRNEWHPQLCGKPITRSCSM